jgi:hypothetical protein
VTRKSVKGIKDGKHKVKEQEEIKGEVKGRVGLLSQN